MEHFVHKLLICQFSLSSHESVITKYWNCVFIFHGCIFLSVKRVFQYFLYACPCLHSLSWLILLATDVWLTVSLLLFQILAQFVLVVSYDLASIVRSQFVKQIIECELLLWKWISGSGLCCFCYRLPLAECLMVSFEWPMMFLRQELQFCALHRLN